MNSPLKWHGGKGMIASWIVSQMPEHMNYVEPYFGGGSVLFAKEQKGAEVMNDLDGELMNFWEVLRDKEKFCEFQRILEATPMCEGIWERCKAEDSSADPVFSAVAFFILVRQSMAGRKTAFTPITTTRLRRGMNEQASAWLSAVEGLPEVHKRLRSVVILNRPALDVIRDMDDPRTLFYLDPPYLHETRVTIGEYGDYEMTRAHHVELLQLVTTLQGKVMISAYPNSLYESELLPRGWRRVEKNVANHASHAKQKGRECETLWLNF